jgi:hypothetical protein
LLIFGKVSLTKPSASQVFHNLVATTERFSQHEVDAVFWQFF